MHLKNQIWLCTVFVAFLSLSTLGEGFKDESPRFNYDTLPKTSFTCEGKLAGRYYADAETDCQLFHVCVKMNVRDTQDFKFLCPNGTTFDQEHQVCMDYFNVVCHGNIGTNPLGQFYELMKLSSGLKNPGLDSNKFSLVDPDVAERNTLGDDFQVDEYNTNRLASSQNTLYQSSKSNRKPSSDIFYKPQKSTTKYYTTSTTPRSTTTYSTTAAPLVFRSPIPSIETTSSTPRSARRPSLETFESYETESVAGLVPQNSFNQQNTKDFQDSFEVRDSEPSTTRRPAVFHNTFRTSFPEKTSTAIPPAQTYQQQASRFNDDFFKKLPSSTETSVSKAAQFYVNSNSGQYSTPEVRQPTTNPFRVSPTVPTTTTIPRRSSSSTTRPYKTSNSDAGFQYEIQSTTEDFRRNPTTTTEKPFFSAKINDRGLSHRGSPLATSGTTSVPSVLVESARHSKFFVPPQSDSQDNDRIKSFSSKIVNAFPSQSSTIRPRSFSGTSSTNHVNRQTNRDNFGFSTILPPTTAEPNTRPTTTLGPFYQTETEATHPKGNTYFQRLTTLKPEKFSIFFSKSTTYANKEYTNTEKESRLPSSGRSTSVYYEPTSTYRTPTTNRIPIDYDQTTAASGSRIQNVDNSYASSTQFPETTTFATTSTTTKPSRRGARRRINRPRPLTPRNFDPEFKYSRQIESTSTKEKSEKDIYSAKNEEIFSAQASVFPGRPKANLFQEQRKEVTQADEVKEETKKAAEDSPKIVENYGRRIRPNRREQIHQRKPVEDNVPAPSEQPQVQAQQPRRLIKRLKVRPSTVAPDAASSSTTSVYIPSTTTTTTTTTVAPTISSTTISQYGSTLRPVKRINVKTKIGHRKFDQESQRLETSQSRNPFFALFEKQRKVSTTTQEPELVTASAEDIARRKQKKLTTASFTKDATTPTTYRPAVVFNDSKNSSSSVIIKVSTKSTQSPFPTPISFKQPILTKLNKKESRFNTNQDGITRSPDYDYSYYNTDDDYNDQTSKLEHKNYGKKPINKKALPSAF